MQNNSEHYPRRSNLAAARGPLARPRRAARIVWLLVLLVMVAAGINFISHYQLSDFLAARVLSVQAPDRRLAANSILAGTINQLIAANPQYKISVSLANLGSDTQLNLGDQNPFDAASVTKLLTAAALLKAVENHTQSLDEPMGAYTAGYQLQQMVNQSNNISWGLIMDEVGYAQLGVYSHSIGLSSFDVSTNTMTAADEAHFLGELYAGKLINSADTSTLLGYMQNTNDDDLIPPAVPAGATTYHKYGLLNGNLHDAAIITSPKTNIALVIFTKSADDTDDANRTAVIHQITAAVATALL